MTEVKTVTSVEIAKLMGKRHDNVIKDIRILVNKIGHNSEFISTYYTHPQNNQEYPMYSITRAGCDWLGKRLKGDVAINYFIKLDEMLPKVAETYIIEPKRKEIEFVQSLQEVLQGMDISIETQYPVLNYRLDAYITSMNVAIEYDEVAHNYQLEDDAKRQLEVEKELGCKFIRVSELDSDLINIGKVLKELLTR